MQNDTTGVQTSSDDSNNTLTLAEHLAQWVEGGYFDSSFTEVDYSGSIKMLSELHDYLNDWKKRTPDKTSLLLKRCADVLYGIERILADEKELRPECIADLKVLKKKIKACKKNLLAAVERDKFKIADNLSSVESVIETEPISNGNDIQPTSKAELKNKRGPYKKQARDTVDKHFRSSIETAIDTELRNSRVPNQEKIIAAAYKQITEKVNSSGDPLYNQRTLRQHLPAAYRNKEYGEIHRQVSERINRLIR